MAYVTILKRIIQLLVLLTAFQANAISLVAGPGWTTADPGFQFTRQVLLDHLNATHYPAFLAGSGLHTITLHPGPLYSQGKPVAGFAGDHTIDLVGIKGETLSDCSVFSRNSINYYNCQILSGSSEYNTTLFLVRFSHELFHIIDRNLQTDRRPNDPINISWRQLNPPGFHYLSNALDRQISNPTLEINGEVKVYSPNFLTEYSAHTIDEDKAEVFAWALVKPQQFFKVISPFNPVLAGKYSVIRQMLNRITNSNEAIIPLPLQGQGD